MEPLEYIEEMQAIIEKMRVDGHLKGVAMSRIMNDVQHELYQAQCLCEKETIKPLED